MPWPELRDELQQLASQSLLRERDCWEASSATTVERAGRSYRLFCSNDYLGLAHHPQLSDALKQAADEWGVGSTASHLVNGHSQEHHALEQALAAFTGRDRALLFSTGYMANIGAVTALLGKRDALFHDRLNHASLLDAGRLSEARWHRYRHCDASHLDSLLARSKGRRKLVATDGVFSMDGDIAPFAELLPVLREHEARLLIDDAHGFGVLGPAGNGCAGVYQLSQQDAPILIGTLGKAFGCFGAFVAGSEELIDTLQQRARSYIYTTAMPPALAAANRAALALVQQEQWRRDQLQELVAAFRAGCETAGLPLLESSTPIQALVLGDSDTALNASKKMLEAGFLVKAIRPPTVPAGSARLRITFSAAHSLQDVQALTDALAGCINPA